MEAEKFSATPLSAPPLCVDFDGTLVRADSLYECMMAALKYHPVGLLRILCRRYRSRAEFKAALWELARDGVDVASFPREPKVVALVAQARSEGRRIELVSASHDELLRSDPALIAMFDEIIGSDGRKNLKGPAKAALLKERHPGGFDYAGDSAADIPVFEAATKGFGVGLSRATTRALTARGKTVETLVERTAPWPALVKSMRLHQWFKNILIFVPTGLALSSIDRHEIFRVTAAFIILGCLASATYLINDLFDLPSDRRHPKKSMRPLASGTLPLVWGMAFAPVIIALALACAYLLGPPFCATLAVYVVLTLGYSFRLKQRAVIDVLVLGLLFTLRVVAGMALGSAPPSQWLLIFSVFFFTGLALLKRDAEISLLSGSGQNALSGRGYTVADRPLVQTTGIATSVASLVIFALFIVSIFENTRQYSAPYFLWVAYFLMAYWLLRLWFISSRGRMNDDPIVFAIKEVKSLVILLAVGFACLLSQIF